MCQRTINYSKKSYNNIIFRWLVTKLWCILKIEFHIGHLSTTQSVHILYSCIYTKYSLVYVHFNHQRDILLNRGINFGFTIKAVCRVLDGKVSSIRFPAVSPVCSFRVMAGYKQHIIIIIIMCRELVPRDGRL